MTLSKHLPIAFILFTLPAAAQIAGRNVNMVSGIQWPEGDPFLQRQNEPSLAVSSRNPAHLLGGSNDYRTVDLPGLPTGETGDAWLGIYKSYDAGQTWKSTIHPGCPQKIAACDGAPLLKNYTAGADPVVRAGTSGMFYYAGLGFTRDTPKKSVVFVSRFIDNNNEENGDPIKYLNTVQVSLGTSTAFLDKPWVTVDIPRANAATCTVTQPLSNGNPFTQSFPTGNIYLAYTSFTDETKPPSQINFSRSTDCGATWSKPAVIGDNALNQGAALAVDPTTGDVYATWRRFKSTGITDAVMFARSTNGGETFSAPSEVAIITPFDQGTTAFSFRTNGYPTIAVDGSSRIYLAWTERNQGAPESSGDARVVLTTSHDGVTWSPRAPVADYPGRGHQFMPAMNFAGGKLMIIFYDVRDDNTVGNFTSLGGGKYAETRVPTGDLAAVPPHPEKVFTNFLLDAAPDIGLGGLLRRHTIDVWAAQADPADVPQFSAARVSQYIFGSRQSSTLIEQLQLNPPNLPLFQQGTVPFMGDYLDLAASPSFLPGEHPGTWKFNTDLSRSVVFHAAWTDNRDVRPPANGDWTDYTPPISASTSGLSLFDPTQPQPACRTGQAGMRNQNIYTSRISQGLTITSASNTKTLGTIQRAFPVVVTNSTKVARSYRLTIVNQPKGGKASFLQVPVAGLPDPLTVLDVTVAPGSSISRMVFARSTDPTASVRVNVDEISAIGAPTAIVDGLGGYLLLNPDPGNPTNPDIANSEVYNPDIANPDIANPDIANPDIANPDIANPDIANPDIANPDIANPDIANPDIANPDIANPDIANPDIANPDIANGAMSDATWKLTNKGNTTATYTIQFLLNGAIPNSIKTQLVVHKTYVTPVSNGCSLVTEPHTVVVANITNPTLLNQQTAGKLRSLILARARAARKRGGEALAERDSVSEILDDSIDNTTVSVGPGETINVTLRFVNPDAGTLPFDPGQLITTVSISHAIDTGGNTPPVAASHLIVATTTLAAGVAGAAYDQFVVAAGGSQPYTFSLVSGSLPPGLSLSAAGEITGTIAAGPANLYSFTVQITDSSSPANPPVTQNLSIQVSNVSLAITGLAAQGPSGANVKPGDTITVTASVNNSGSPADSVITGITLNATGTASANCGLPSPASASLLSGVSQNFVFSCTGVSGTGTLTFSVGMTAIDHISGASISVSPATSNAVTIFGTPPQIAVAATAGGPAYASGVWTNQNVVVTFTCTPVVGTPTVKNVTVVSEGANQTVASTCTDLAGNQTNGSFSGINIDKTPPQINMAATVGGAQYFGNFTNLDVIVTTTCSDPGGSGATIPTQQQSFNTDGTSQAFGRCTDLAGNVSSSSFGPIRIVKTVPQLTASLSVGTIVYSPGSWTNQSVVVNFACTPAAGLSVSFLTPPVLVSNGSNQFVTGRCTDQAGNTATVQAGPINVDRTPPTITLQNKPSPNFAGWYNTDVTITWLCTDNIAGQSTVSRTVSSEGANQTVSANCIDLAGNTATASQTVSIDKTPPVINVQVSPTAPSSGWYRGPATVTFLCSDGLSGVASSNPTGNTTVSGDTTGTTVSGICRDQAGNVATLVTPPIRIDTTAPTLQLQSIVPQNGAGWSNGPVTVTWACNDGGSGTLTPTVPQVVSVSGSATASCTDIAGNTATSTANNIRIDTTPPLVNMISPLNGFTYTLNQIVFANYNCIDSSSGIASCGGTVGPGQRIDTSVHGGPFTFTVTGVDVAGNKTQVVRTYFVN